MGTLEGPAGAVGSPGFRAIFPLTALLANKGTEMGTPRSLMCKAQANVPSTGP